MAKRKTDAQWKAEFEREQEAADRQKETGLLPQRWTRISKWEARRRFRAGMLIGLLGCNLYPGMFWQPCPIDPERRWEHQAVVYGDWTAAWTPDDATDDEKEQAWEHMYDDWAWYNTDSERGRYAHYYRPLYS